MKSGVYKITNVINNRFYIGSSFNIESRWKQHQRCLKAGNHQNGNMQSDFNLYGENAFSYSVVEVTEDYINKEQELLDIYHDNGNMCYNISKSAEHPGNEISPERMKEYHRILKEDQDKKIPFLSYKKMMEILNYKSPAPVQNLLERMVELGLAEEVEFGERQKRYRIL